MEVVGPTVHEMADMSENELETLIMKNRNEDARFILGKLMIEGTSDKVP